MNHVGETKYFAKPREHETVRKTKTNKKTMYYISTRRMRKKSGWAKHKWKLDGKIRKTKLLRRNEQDELRNKRLTKELAGRQQSAIET